MSIDQSNVFEERAENLSKDELSDWTTLTEKDRLNIRKLKGAGAKLLIGPRGCGKSTLMRVAYFELLGERSAFPIYVNYSRSMALEPLFHSNANAVLIFRQWVLCKIAREALVSATELGIALPKDLSRISLQADRLIVGLERGEVAKDTDLLISPSQLCLTMRPTHSQSNNKRSSLRFFASSAQRSSRRRRRCIQALLLIRRISTLDTTRRS